MSAKTERKQRSPSPVGTLRAMATEQDKFVVYPRMWEHIGGWEKYAYSAPLVGKPGQRGKLCSEGFVFSVDGKKTPDLKNGDIYEGATVVVEQRPGDSPKSHRPSQHQFETVWLDSAPEPILSINGNGVTPDPTEITDAEILNAVIQVFRSLISK